MVLSILLMVMGSGFILLFYVFVPDQYTTNYTAVLTDKINRLKSIEEPKIILVGNSNLAFGIKSQLIMDEIGMPVVNLGLHGGLGDAFLEEISKFNIGVGDVVVICHTEYKYDIIEDIDLAWKTIGKNIEFYKLIGWRDIVPMIKSFPIYVCDTYDLISSQTGNPPIAGVYSRAAFNEYGDIEWERLDSQYEAEEGILPTITSTCIRRLNNLNEYCISRGATLVVAGYPIVYRDFDNPEEDFDIFQKELEEALDFTVISQFSDYFMEYEYFYDGRLHLTTEGAEIRTKILIEDLNEYLLQY